jgi:hypothetical protein
MLEHEKLIAIMKSSPTLIFKESGEEGVKGILLVTIFLVKVKVPFAIGIIGRVLEKFPLNKAYEIFSSLVDDLYQITKFVIVLVIVEFTK